MEKNTSTSLLISWSAIPQEFIHGVLRAYVIEYWLVDHINDSLNATVEPWVTEVELTNLKKFANYSIKFAGITSKGVGNWTEVMLQTAEDGKCIGNKLKRSFVRTQIVGTPRSNVYACASCKAIYNCAEFSLCGCEDRIIGD